MNTPRKRLRPLEKAILSTIVVLQLTMLLAMLVGCATAGPTPEQNDALSDALDRIGTRTAGQATGMGGREVSRGVYTATGGSLAGQIGSAAVRNTTTEIQRWWSTRR